MTHVGVLWLVWNSDAILPYWRIRVTLVFIVIFCAFIRVFALLVMIFRRLLAVLLIHLTKFWLSIYLDLASAGNLVKRSLKDTIKCFEDSKFYRNPERPTHKLWTNSECSKYYLCLDGEVFEFKCSVGLLFDVMRQICDFKQNVDNCDITAGLPPLSF